MSGKELETGESRGCTVECHGLPPALRGYDLTHQRIAEVGTNRTGRAQRAPCELGLLDNELLDAQPSET
jgi:hypothetical protein